MLLTITTTVRPATDLGFLLGKHPERVQAFDRSFGTAYVFYPDAAPERCTAALLLDVDPIRLAKTRKRRTSRSASTSTTGRTPRRRCWPRRWPVSSARRCAAAAPSGPGWPPRRSR